MRCDLAPAANRRQIADLQFICSAPQSSLCPFPQIAKLVPMAELLAPESLMAFVALTALEIVLGVDNLVFIAILTGRLPPENRGTARRLGLGMAAFGRIALLL